MKVIDQLTADFKSLDAANATYYDQQNSTFKGRDPQRVQKPHC